MLILTIMRVSKYYRTTIPREIRMLPGINGGNEAELVFKDGKVIVRKKGEKHIKRLYYDYETGESSLELPRKSWRPGFYTDHYVKLTWQEVQAYSWGKFRVG